MEENIIKNLKQLYEKTSGFENNALVLNGYSSHDLHVLCQKVTAWNGGENPNLIISNIIFADLVSDDNLFSRQNDGWLFDDYKVIKKEHLPLEFSRLDDETIYIFSPTGKLAFGKMKR